eukprot:comp4880_c0_seq1/m.989 comp4880_c0_seq1/g.989  ORF comp4880_c0_seq1/g.989 comp4880_c0_seq1/m.989 type:complete len:409 (-) comp4880_c0_seq1:132-1358(-)
MESKDARAKLDRFRALLAYLLDHYDGHAGPFNTLVAQTTALAFSGGGTLGAAYCGALRVLEQHGLDLKKVTKLIGTSAGAITAAALAVGHDSDTGFEEVLRADLNRISRFEGMAYLKVKGADSGSELESWVGRMLASACKNPNITLGEVQSKYGKELVIVATELDTGLVRKFHPATDPNLEVRKAVRMSCGVPGIFEPYEYENHIYVDGGLLNNNPIDELPEIGGIGLVVSGVEWLIKNGLTMAHLDATNRDEAMVLERIKKKADKLAHKSAKIKGLEEVVVASIRAMQDVIVTNQLQSWGGLNLSDPMRHQGENVPRLIFVCAGDYKAQDTEIKETQLHEIYMLGCLSAYCAMQAYMRYHVMRRRESLGALCAPGTPEAIEMEISEKKWIVPFDIMLEIAVLMGTAA